MKANSDELITFVTVVESGSFSRAAERLQQANSVVSRTVKTGEQTGRDPAQPHDTPNQPDPGRRKLLSAGAKGVERYGRSGKCVAGKPPTPAGLLRVDAATPVVLHLLTPLVAEFRERYPEMSLSLVSSENFINLIERKVDIAIRVGELTDSTLKARKLMASYRRILASPPTWRSMARQRRWPIWYTIAASALTTCLT